MKRFLMTILSLWLFSASAEQSPITDYLYVGRYVTNNVQGMLSGDMADYKAMRYEDELFLAEAMLEREYLADGFASSNAYRRAIDNTNTIVSSFIKSSDRYSPYACRKYADLSVPLSGSTRYCRGYVRHVESASNTWKTVSNVVRVVQTMTNGTVNSRTSAYSYVSNVAWVVTFTNVEITASNELNSLVFSANHHDTISFYESSVRKHPLYWENVNMGYPYSLYFLTNSYSIVRNLRRTMPISTTVATYKTTDTTYNKCSWKYFQLTGDDHGVPSLIRDEDDYGLSFYVWINTQYDETTGQKAASDSQGWHLKNYTETDAYKIVEMSDPKKTALMFTTRIPQIVETDAGRQVVIRIHPYLKMIVNRSKSTIIGYSTNANSLKWESQSKSTNETFICVMPVDGNIERVADDTQMVTFIVRVTDLGDSIRSAISGYGWSNLSEYTEPAAILPRRPGEQITKQHAQSGLTENYRRTLLSKSENIWVGFGLIYLLDLKPRTTLSSWTEYN